MQYNVHDCTLFNKLTIIWCFYYALLIQLDNELDLMHKKTFVEKVWHGLNVFNLYTIQGLNGTHNSLLEIITSSYWYDK